MQQKTSNANNRGTSVLDLVPALPTIARRCGISKATASRMIRDGKIQIAIRVGGRLRIDEAELTAWIESQRVKNPE